MAAETRKPWEFSLSLLRAYPVFGNCFSSGDRARAHSHHKVGRRRCAHILDSMFVIRMHESDGARPETVARAVDGQLDRSFSNQPHFGMHVVVWRGGGARPGGRLVGLRPQ